MLGFITTYFLDVRSFLIGASLIQKEFLGGLLVQQGLVGYAPPSVSLDPEVEKKQLQD